MKEVTIFHARYDSVLTLRRRHDRVPDTDITQRKWRNQPLAITTARGARKQRHQFRQVRDVEPEVECGWSWELREEMAFFYTYEFNVDVSVDF